MNLKLDFNGKTLLKNWWGVVRDNFLTVQNTLNTHQTSAVMDHPDKSVTTAKIADYAVGQTQLAQYSVSSAKIYPGAVQTAHIKDGNVTKAKLEQDIQNRIDMIDNLREATEAVNQRINNLAIYGNRNRFLEIENYANNNLVTDSNGNKYLCAYLDFENIYYNSFRLNIGTFARELPAPSKLVFEISLAAWHGAADNCDTYTNFEPNESYIRLTYKDGTEAVFKFSEEDIISSKNKSITIAGDTRTYECFGIRKSVEYQKEISSVLFVFTGANYAYGTETSDTCVETMLIDKITCYDNDSLAAMEDLSELRDKITELSGRVESIEAEMKA